MSDIYLYDEIVSEKYTDWDEKEHGFVPNDLSEPLRKAEKDETVNIFVNSPGGEIFAAAAMTSEIKRARQKGVKVNAYVDGIAASAASFLIMACDNVFMYEGTMLMVHKPMCFCIGNADDFLKAAEDLENIQEGTCMPLYRSKLKGDEEELKAMIKNETWLNAEQAAEVFEIAVIDTFKDVKGSISLSVISKFGYKNTPEQLKETPKQVEEQVDYTEFEERIKNAGGKK